ncbi:MAG: hydantoinase/oxoprolinase family protein [Xanthobacteraceae bacterium]
MPNDVSLAVDIGGTFTDVVLRAGPELFVEKTLTTHDDLLRGFFAGIHAVLAKAKLSPAAVNGAIVHATTVVTNALIERKGARVAMIFTRGFADILRIRDERRYDMYDPQIEFPAPLVEPEDTFVVDERIYADGSVKKRPNNREVDELAQRLHRSGVGSVGICFLHSYKNAENEHHVARELQKRLPSILISQSSEIAPQIREYLRASTTAANAYTRPITQPYLDRLERRLGDEGFTSSPLIMLSSGGVVGPSTAGRMPVRMIESGPAAGALGAAYAAKALNLSNLLAFDMGGTTAKICVVRDFQPVVTGQFEIDRIYRFKEGSGLPVSVPCIDMIEIGAGGGSIASVSDLGLLRVGPRSAGSQPGPACYGLGGEDPTVTDADVVLGAIDAEKFLGGTMRLDTRAAERAISKVAKRLDKTQRETARGICRLVCETMASAVKAHAADRGVNYRGVPLLAFGGAGPVHACEVAQLLKSEIVIFPPLASVYSALGSLVTPARLDLVRSGLSRLDRTDWTQVNALYDEMESVGRNALAEAGCRREDVNFRYAADLRYSGQHYDLMVELDGRPNAANGAAMIRRRFDDEYVKRYRITQDEVEVEVVNWRLSASSNLLPPPEIGASRKNGSHSRATRRVHIWGDDQEVAVVPRAKLARESRVDGPVIVEEAETTLVIPAGWTVSVAELDCVMARKTQ